MEDFRSCLGDQCLHLPSKRLNRFRSFFLQLSDLAREMHAPISFSEVLSSFCDSDWRSLHGNRRHKLLPRMSSGISNLRPPLREPLVVAFLIDPAGRFRTLVANPVPVQRSNHLSTTTTTRTLEFAHLILLKPRVPFVV